MSGLYRPSGTRIVVDPTGGRTHPILLEAEGVREAAEAVVAAKAAAGKVREERDREHREWEQDAKRNVLVKGWKPAPEPETGLRSDEIRHFNEVRYRAEQELEWVVAANTEAIQEKVRARDAEAVRQLREHVAAIDVLVNEFAQLQNVLTQLRYAGDKSLPVTPPRFFFDDLVKIGRTDADGVLMFEEPKPDTHRAQPVSWGLEPVR